MVSPLDRAETGQLGRRSTVGSAFVLALLIFFGMAAAHAEQAQAATTCAFDPDTGTLSLTPGTGDLQVSVAVSAGPLPPAGAIVVSDLTAPNAPVLVGCAAGSTVRVQPPSTANIARVTVEGGSSNDLLEIDLGGGSFTSGLSADGEISWRVSLGAGSDTLRVKGNKLFVAGNFRVVYGNAPGPIPTGVPAGSLNLSAGRDSRADVSVDTDVEIHEVIMGAGNDVVSGSGAFGTGGPWEATGLDFDGGAGNDVLRATTINNSKSNTYRQVGGIGDDELEFDAHRSAEVQLTQDGGEGKDVLRATTINNSKSNNLRQAGGAGNDELEFDAHRSAEVQLTQDGGEGKDALRATNLNSSRSNVYRQTGGGGNDALRATNLNSSRSNIYRQAGGAGNDELEFDAHRSSELQLTQDGGAGDDALRATNLNSSRSNIYRQAGGAGKDVLRATNLNSSRSNIYRQGGGSGDDELTVEIYNSSRVTILQGGGPGSDVLRATNLNSSRSNVYRDGGPGSDKCPGDVGRVKAC